MKKFHTALTAAALIALAGPAFAADDITSSSKVETKVEQKSDGSYQRQESAIRESNDASGTETKVESRVKVDEKPGGDVDKIVKTKTVVDPEGMLNAETTETSYKMKKEKGKTVVERTKHVNGKVVEETRQENDPEAQKE